MKCKYSKNGDHRFKEVSRSVMGYGNERVIEWCSNCGTLEVFDDVDNRAMNIQNLRPDSVTILSESNAKEEHAGPNATDRHGREKFNLTIK